MFRRSLNIWQLDISCQKDVYHLPAAPVDLAMCFLGIKKTAEHSYCYKATDGGSIIVYLIACYISGFIFEDL